MTIPSERFRHSWVCPHCGHLHEWDWPLHDRPQRDDRILLTCEACDSELTMIWSGLVWKYVR